MKILVVILIVFFGGCLDYEIRYNIEDVSIQESVFVAAEFWRNKGADIKEDSPGNTNIIYAPLLLKENEIAHAKIIRIFPNYHGVIRYGDGFLKLLFKDKVLISAHEFGHLLEYGHVKECNHIMNENLFCMVLK